MNTDCQQIQRVPCAKSKHEVFANVSLYILKTNHSTKPVVLQKHNCNSLTPSLLECIAQSECNDGLKPTVEVYVIHYKEVEDQARKMERHIKDEHEDVEQKGHDWN